MGVRGIKYETRVNITLKTAGRAFTYENTGVIHGKGHILFYFIFNMQCKYFVVYRIVTW